MTEDGSSIRTTHAGSLHRPASLAAALIKLEDGLDVPDFRQVSRDAINGIVERQALAGLDVLNDGEMSRANFTGYVTQRLSGFGGPKIAPRFPRMDEFPDFAEMLRQTRGKSWVPYRESCVGPVGRVNDKAVRTDVEDLLDAAASAGIGADRLFMTAASPGAIAYMFENRYYGSREEYLGALAEAMHEEYAAIVEAGITLQLDCPDFGLAYNTEFYDLSVPEFRRELALAVEALNEATKGLPAELLRMHVCWGNHEAPHVHDIELKDIVDLVLQCRPAGISIEACNPRHGHEWKLFESVELPEGKYLIPGVIDTTTNFVEHPELVAQRILNYASTVGRERVVAGTDCGFGTSVGRQVVAESVAWAKLAAMAAGARIASTLLRS
jgi:5-methyltetrahydropteroyltriglutamate--homocysteine methyltransferase